MMLTVTTVPDHSRSSRTWRNSSTISLQLVFSLPFLFVAGVGEDYGCQVPGAIVRYFESSLGTPELSSVTFLTALVRGLKVTEGKR